MLVTQIHTHIYIFYLPFNSSLIFFNFILFSYICCIISLCSCAILVMSIVLFLAFAGVFFEVVLMSVITECSNLWHLTLKKGDYIFLLLKILHCFLVLKIKAKVRSVTFSPLVMWPLITSSASFFIHSVSVSLVASLFSITSNVLQLQDLCTCCVLCPQCSPSRYHASIPSLIEVCMPFFSLQWWLHCHPF